MRLIPLQALHTKADRELLDDIGQDDPPEEATDADARHSYKELDELELHSSYELESCVQWEEEEDDEGIGERKSKGSRYLLHAVGRLEAMWGSGRIVLARRDVSCEEDDTEA